MKLIDEKGKLFGKVNIIDLIVVLMVVAIAVAAVVRQTSNRRNVGEFTPGDKQYCYITVFSSLQVPEVGANLKVGQKVVAGGKFTNAEIVDVKVEPAAYVGTNANGEAVLSEHPLWKDVTVVIKEEIDRSNVALKVGGQEARIGFNYIIKTQDVEANGRVRDITWSEDEN